MPSHALVVGPALVLRDASEPAHLAFEVPETVRRDLDGQHAH